MGGKVQGIRSINGRHKIDRGRLRIVWEMEAKELICTTHGHELGGMGDCWLEEGCRVEGNEGEKKWDKCNSIIVKIYLKIKFSKIKNK